ncbi:hypothetical protein MCHI_000597 [Candidatus Magnetoovum chiemensis]|nr:hypothetical protein MCHI_000597 [Candidatus Magnetoovum chiemensis]
MINTPFEITITAVDVDGNTLTEYNGTVALSYNYGTIDPSSVTLTDGVATLNITVDTVGYDGLVTASSSSVNSVMDISNAFDVLGECSTNPLDPTTATSTSSGGSSSVTVTTSDSACTWTAASNASWITVNSGASGTGSGTVGYTVSANTGIARSGTITVAGQTFTVQQDDGCTYSIDPTSVSSVSSSGATSSVTVTPSDSACTWTAASNASWITVNSGASGTGSGTIGYTVSANSGASRTGTLTIAGETFTVTQSNGCTYSISPTSVSSVSSSGATSSVTVTPSDSACTWTAASNASWITVDSGSSGTGSGTVGYTVSANTGIARSGTLTIAGETFTVTQSNGCTYSIDPTSVSSVSSSGATSSVPLHRQTALARGLLRRTLRG